MNGGEEEALHGGTMTAGVVRVGDTVRRPVGRWTPAVHSLLRHLEDVGFEGAPRVLGIDEKGREVLTYLPGDPQPSWADEAVFQTGRLVRRLHEAMEGFVPPADAVWRFPPLGSRAPSGLIGHNDQCPVNVVYADGIPYGIIDWDMAGPVPPLYDLALAATAFAPLRPDRFWPRPGCPEPPDRIGRLRLFCDGYGVDGLQDRLALLEAIKAYLRDELVETIEFGGQGISPYRTFLGRGEHRYRLLELEWLAQNREALVAAMR